jgi:hypothetical protein
VSILTREVPLSYHFEEAGYDLQLEATSVEEWQQHGGSGGHDIFPSGFFHQDGLFSMAEGERSRFLFSGAFAFPEGRKDSFTGRVLVPEGAAVVYDIQLMYVGTMKKVRGH